MKRLTTICIVALLTLQATASVMPSGTRNRMMWASICGRSDVTTDGTKYNDDIGKLLLSWRMLPGDTWETAFDIYSAVVGGTGRLTKVNAEPIAKSTCYQIASPPTTGGRIYYLTYANQYPALNSANRDSIQKLIRGNALGQCTVTKEQLTDRVPYTSIALKSTEDVCDIDSIVYPANDVSIGDLDGDGEMEIIVKRIQGHKNAAGTLVSDGTGATTSLKHVRHLVIWDAYKLDGTFLWRVKSGPNAMLGNSSAFAVADFDGDGRAEMCIRTAEGTVFGDGSKIGDTNGDGKTDYRTSTGGWVDHYCSDGPEFISMIDGQTGAELDRAPFIDRETSESWGDGYWKRANSLRIGVGCFDGRLPSVVVGRGVYAHSVIEAWDFRDGTFSKRFRFDTNDKGTGRDGNPHSSYAAQGNHSLNVADLDGDGYDEIMYGSMAVDHDGVGLWTTKLGHGDANHVGKFLPDSEGLQVWHCLEGGKTCAALHDAATGSTIWNYVATSDNDCGRCMVADIDPSSPGCEFWWAGSNAHSSAGKDLGYKPSSCNMGIWFDGGLTRQLINESIISNDRAGGRVFTMYRYPVTFINGSKSNPAWYGDLLGDWREEVIVPDNTKLNDIKIFSTWYVTEHKFPWLMTDHTYYMSAVNQNIGYNQPTNLGYYLGTDMDRSLVPLPSAVETVVATQPTHKRAGIYDLGGRRVTSPEKGVYIRDGKKLIVK